MNGKQINWQEVEERASRMTFAQLYGALGDIRKTLPYADQMDRLNGTDNGGYYRDEASIYYQELKIRLTKRA